MFYLQTWLTLGSLFVDRYMCSRGANSVDIPALPSKPKLAKLDADVHILGCKISNKLDVEHGRDHAEKYNNLSSLWLLAPCVSNNALDL